MTNWMTACEIIDMETFLGAEIMFNLFTVVKDCSSKDEGIRLQVKSHSVFRYRLYLFISNELSGEHLTCYLFSFFLPSGSFVAAFCD